MPTDDNAVENVLSVATGLGVMRYNNIRDCIAVKADAFAAIQSFARRLSRIYFGRGY